ncbi:MAG TPA: hypothetical protein PK583_02025, partial [Gammaproteobacteria bacterium]|nr:hypothetical protein [Gammaproteobacteria bacterium]
EALYLRDPDQNGVELYWDKPRELWPVDAKGHLQMYSKRLDLDNLLTEPAPEKPTESDIKNQRMRLQALSRWENEGGALPEANLSETNPEKIHPYNQGN